MMPSLSEESPATSVVVAADEADQEKEPPASPGAGRVYPCTAKSAPAIPIFAGAPSFYIRPCDVGLGVFAGRHIQVGEVILRIWGPTIDFAETKRRGPRECMAIQIGPGRYIDTQAPGVFVNHSCEPNAGICDDVNMIALRDIAAGEEIRFDYSTTMEEQSFTMECLCGLPQCRHVISDFSTLPERLQQRYLELRIVMKFIQLSYEQSHGLCRLHS